MATVADIALPILNESVLTAANLGTTPSKVADSGNEAALSPTDEKQVYDNSLKASELEDGSIFGLVRRPDGTTVSISWTPEEQKRVVRKADVFLLPIFTMMFFFMALDRTNISGVLTSTFLKDTHMTQEQVNTGTSLLWLGIVLLEIPSNIVLQRVGPHRWIPCQVIVWGLAEVLQSQVKHAGGWYAARLFLGLLESGFIPGSLWILSQWYTRSELALRTIIFFFGTSFSSAFGSLIAAGCIKLSGHRGLAGWQWIFIIDGCGTIAAGLIALALLPKSAYHTAGLFRGKGWFTQREADIFVARVEKDDPLKSHRHDGVQITFSDVTGVLLDWRIWPHLLMCLTGLQAVGGLNIWGGANLLSAPAPIISSILSVILGWLVDRYDRRGLGILFVSFWILSGVVSLYNLPISASDGQWSFYAAFVFTGAAPIWQAINVTWIALNARTPQRRAIAYAVYIGCSNLSGTYGAQVFRGSDAPKYRVAFAACLSLAAVFVAITLFQLAQYHISNYYKDRKWKSLTPDEQEAYTAQEVSNDNTRLDFRYRL